MFKSLKLCVCFLAAFIMMSMPVVHALPLSVIKEEPSLIEQDPMYIAISSYYREIGVFEENIEGSATEFVKLLNEHKNDFPSLEPEQVRNLFHPDVSNLNAEWKDQLMELAMTAFRNYFECCNNISQ